MFDLVGMQATSLSPSREEISIRSRNSEKGHLKIDEELVSSQHTPPEGYLCPPDTRYISQPIVDADGTKRHCLSMYVDRYFPLYTQEEMQQRNQKYKEGKLEDLRPRDDILDFTYALKQIVSSIPPSKDQVKKKTGQPVQEGEENDSYGLGLQKQMDMIYVAMVEMRQAPSIFIARIKDTIEIIKNLENEDDPKLRKTYEVYKDIATRLEALLDSTPWIKPYLEEYIPKYQAIY